MTNKKVQKIQNGDKCSVMKSIDLIRGRWSLPIVHSLMDGKRRFKELERGVEGINTRMLVKELKTLEREGVVNRQAFATVPPTVEYSLTEKGNALQGVINELRIWTEKFS